MMTPKTKAFLHGLDKLLAKGDKTSQEVMDVIAALRGPDHVKGRKRECLKAVTTVPIRRAALPLTAEAGTARGARSANGCSFRLMDDGDAGRVDLRLNAKTGDTWDHDHFDGHAYRAAEVLGLKVIR